MIWVGLGTVLGLRSVKSAEETHRLNPSTNTNDGTRILLHLYALWGDRERIICADTHFQSVEVAELLLQKNLKFIGVMKTDTRRFPMKHFREQELLNKVDFKALRTSLHGDYGENDIVPLCWLDRARRHFFSTADRTTVTVDETKVRWRQQDEGPCPVEVRIPMPELVSDYYATADVWYLKTCLKERWCLLLQVSR